MGCVMIRKAVIPAAGLGTRMLPAAKAVPKELLPIVDRPTLQYIVEEAADAGVDDVLLVTSREKRALEDHFDRNRELEERLRVAGKESLLGSINALMGKVKVHAVRQPEQRGLGDAVVQARRHVGGEPFLCQLGDAVFGGEGPLPARQLIEAHAKLGTALIGLEEVPAAKVGRYGIVAGTCAGDDVLRIEKLVEKPRKEEAPSRLAIAARYVLTPAIFECIERTPAGVGGEVQLTDALRLLLEREPIHGVVLKARRYDIGNPADWLETNLIFGWADAALRERLEPLMRSLLEGRAARPGG
jgi:UTP--glucose-1-phosphate uridylyltransferase